METAGHGHNRAAAQLPEDQPAGMALHRCGRKVRDIIVRYFRAVRDLRGEVAQAAAQDNAGLRRLRNELLYVSRSFLDLCQHTPYLCPAKLIL